MTTAQVIIQAAYREGNLIPVGKQPSDVEMAEALPRLNAYVQGIFGYEMGENLVDWLFPAPQRTASLQSNYPQGPGGCNMPSGVYPYPPVNTRVIFGGVTGTLYFPESPLDGSRMAIVQGSGAGDAGMAGSTLTLNGNGRTIEGANTLAYTDPVAPRAWLYRADLADWAVVEDMAADDDMPFPKELDDLFICMLAIRLAPRYGKTTAVETSNTAIVMLKKLKTRYKQAMKTTYGSENIPNSFQSYLLNNGLGWFQ